LLPPLSTRIVTTIKTMMESDEDRDKDGPSATSGVDPATFAFTSRWCPATTDAFSMSRKKCDLDAFFCCHEMIGMITDHHEYSTHHGNREKKASPQAGGYGKRATLHHRIADKDSSSMR